jgi:Ni,Fe-hydrogenase III large subunit
VVERLRGTGRLTREVALDLGVVGPAARASGLPRDVRRDHPYAYYRDLDFQVPAREGGDALARFQLHADEMHESLTLIEQMLLRLPGGPLAQHLGGLPAGRWGLGLVESPRGRTAHWVRAGAGGVLEDWRVRSASHANWPAVAVAMPGDIVPDFPLVNKSFNLCYACVDR